MKHRLAKKIMRACNGCVPYLQQILCCSDIARDLPKLKQYWEPRWALYYASKGGCCYGRVDHRIVKAEKVTVRYSRKLMNNFIRLSGKTIFDIVDMSSSVNKLKSYSE